MREDKMLVAALFEERCLLKVVRIIGHFVSQFLAVENNLKWLRQIYGHFLVEPYLEFGHVGSLDIYDVVFEYLHFDLVIWFRVLVGEIKHVVGQGLVTSRLVPDHFPWIRVSVVAAQPKDGFHFFTLDVVTLAFMLGVVVMIPVWIGGLVAHQGISDFATFTESVILFIDLPDLNGKRIIS